MKPSAFDYVRPRDLESALAALRDGGETSRAIAGGQSLGPMLNMRLARPSLLVDIGRIAELRRIERRNGAWLLGAAVTHAMVEDRQGNVEGMLPDVARTIAYRAIRNRGTIGGSLAHADPAGDWALALSALDASVIAMSERESRKIPVLSLARGAFSTCLARDELLTEIRIPAHSSDARWGYAKACRKTGEFADAAAAVFVDPARRIARVVLGALDGAPRVLSDSAELLDRSPGAGWLESIEQAVARAAPALNPIDVRLQAGTLARALSQARRPR